jgi:ribosomal protein L40E
MILRLFSSWRAFSCRVWGHKPLRGEPVHALATLRVRQLDGQVVERQVNTRTYPVACVRCGAALPSALVIEKLPSE